MSSTRKTRNSVSAGLPAEVLFACERHNVRLELFGEQDRNLKLLERELDLEIKSSGEGALLKGQDSEVELAYDLLTQLGELVEQGNHLFPGDVERSLKQLAKNRHLRLEEFFRDHVVISGRKHSIVPKTPRQKCYIDAIRRYDLVFGVGPAGTGKTYLAMAMALSALLRKEVKRVVLCRPAVEAGERLGFLPGDMAEKVNPYLRPLYDALHDMLDLEQGRELMEKGALEVAPLAFMRGRTLSQAFVILDEAQNTSKVQMKMLLTRLGRNSKCVVTGDVTQIDLPRGVTSGMVDAISVLKDTAGVSFVNFTEEDVLRHPLVASILEAYRKNGGAAAQESADKFEDSGGGGGNI
ncbi:MAG: PhoH family protein [Deltaproteobacteria bacterium]|nr:PhoH family protein [Deltaproteobacteria bacterium]